MHTKKETPHAKAFEIRALQPLHPRRVVVSVSTSRSRDGLETYQRLVSVSSREKLSTSRSRLDRSRPFTSRAQDQFPDGHADGAIRSVNGL